MSYMPFLFFGLVAEMVAIMLSLPIYLRGATYYLHTRFCGVQIKRSLNTPDQRIAIIRASKFIESMMMAIDITRVRKYELDLSRGIARADGEEDHARLMELLAVLVEQQPQNQPRELE
jgi:hypothetical protein